MIFGHRTVMTAIFEPVSVRRKTTDFEPRIFQLFFHVILCVGQAEAVVAIKLEMCQFSKK